MTLTEADQGKQRKYDRLLRTPHFEQVVAANQAYAAACIPDAESTAGSRWSLSCIPGRSTTLSRISMSSMEVFVVTVPDDEVTDDLQGFIVIAESPVLDAFDSLAAFEASLPHLSIERSDYRAAGTDQLRVWGAQGGLAAALGTEVFASAARVLALRLMQSTTSYKNGHNHLLAEHALRRHGDTDHQSSAEPVGPSGSSAVGFDQPYSGRAGEGSFPEYQTTSAEAHERARTEHDDLCRRLIGHLICTGVEAGEHLDGVRVDLAWRDLAGRQVIPEIKSCAATNDQDQLRFGLGQLLEYRTRLVGKHVNIVCYLVLSRVVDTIWFDICKAADVVLVDARKPESIESIDLCTEDLVDAVPRPRGTHAGSRKS